MNLSTPDKIRDIFSSKNKSTDDYSNTRVPKNVSWSYWAIMLPITGGGTAGFWLAFGPSLVTSYGMRNTMIGLVYAVIMQTLLGYALVHASARSRLSSDLATRGLGFGFLGSTVTALIFATNWFFYWALESQILGSGLASFIHIPEQIGWVIVGAMTIPLTLYGMVFVTRFQNWTIPIFFIWLGWNIIVIFRDTSHGEIDGFFSYSPPGAITGWIGLLGVISAVNGLVAVVPLLSMEFARFARPNDSSRRRNWGFLGVATIPQNIFTWLIYLPIGILIWRATGATNPGLAFVQLSGWIGFLGLFVTQLRINLQNTYAESMALSTLFARVFKVTPGRAFWSLITCIVGTVLIFLNTLNYINQVLAAEAILLFTWIGVIGADYVIVRGIMRKDVGDIEHRRAYLRRFNPTGLISFASGSVVGAFLHYAPIAFSLNGIGWSIASGLASFVGFAVAFLIHPLVVDIFGRRSNRVGGSVIDSYLVRRPESVPSQHLTTSGEVECASCSSEVDPTDVSRCPVISFNWICSECCSSDRTCKTACQKRDVVFPTISVLPMQPSKRT